MKFLIEAGTDITIKNKNCESIREFIERYSQDMTEEYLDLENERLLNALLLGRKKVKEVFRIVVNNWRNDKHYVK